MYIGTHQLTIDTNSIDPVYLINPIDPEDPEDPIDPEYPIDPI